MTIAANQHHRRGLRGGDRFADAGVRRRTRGGAAMDAIARQPEASGPISRTLFVGLAMIETMAIYCLVVALLVLFANPFVH